MPTTTQQIPEALASWGKNRGKPDFVMQSAGETQALLGERLLEQARDSRTLKHLRAEQPPPSLGPAPLRLRRVLLVLLLRSWGGDSRSQLAKCFSGGEAADIHADLGQDHQGGRHVDPLDQRQVHAQGLEQRPRRLEPQVVALAPALCGLTV